MEKEFKKIINFKFNDKQLNDLVAYIKEKIENSPFKGHVFIKGNVIRNQLMKLPINPKEFFVVIDNVQGGITFPIWLSYQANIFKNGENPLINYQNGESVLILAPLNNIKLQCRQTKLEYTYKDESAPNVNFADVETDAKMCGLTIDSLYYNISDESLYDFTGKGFNDLEHNIIRATDTTHVFKDDPSKILYALRMAGDLNFGIEKNTWVSMVKNAQSISNLPVTKLREELDKILLSVKPSVIIRKMLNCNVLDETWPHLRIMMELVNTPFQKSDSVYEHTLNVIDGVPAILDVRLAALFHDIGKINSNDQRYLYHELLSSEMTEKLMTVMGYSETTIERVITMIEHHEDLTKFGGREIPGVIFIRKFRSKLGEQFQGTLELIDANNKAQLTNKRFNQVRLFKEAVKRIDAKDAKTAKNRQLNNTPSKLPINGNDIKTKFGINSGPLIGNILTKVKEEYDKNPQIGKEECFSICREIIQMAY